MKLILNDLSYDKNITNISNKYEIKEYIKTFVELLSLLQREKVIEVKGDIESLQDILSIDFGCNYNFQKWLNDSSEDITNEHKMILKRIIEKYNVVVNEDVNSNFYCKISENEYKSEILHKAIEDNCNALSFKTIDFFSGDSIQGTHIFLDEEHTEYREENKVISNICDNSKIIFLREECKKDKSSNIVSVYDFWDNKESLFPNLIFCENVKEHIYKNPEPRHIRAIIKRLEILNKYYIEHDIFDIKTLGFNARTESDSVKNNTKLKQLRNFKKPDGSYSYFYNHISFTGSFPGRIHFLEDNNLKKIYIGYIGVHLSTAKY